MSTPAVAIVGAGSMGGAIMHGLAAVGGYESLTATNRSRAKAASLAQLPGVRSLALEDAADGNLRAVESADIVLVGVKPVMVPNLLTEIGGALGPEAVVVSLAAGVTIATFERILPAGQPVMRAMPNTPSLVGKGVTGLSAGTRVNAEQAAAVRALFETVGSVIDIPEAQIDALSTISGSGPAYLFFVIEQFAAAAVRQGFTPEQARLMTEGTFIGSAALLESSGDAPAELRRRVTSPKGTTERAIAELSESGLEDILVRATDAALARAAELAAGA